MDPKENSITKYSGTKTSQDPRQQSFLVDQKLVLFFFSNSRYFVTLLFSNQNMSHKVELTYYQILLNKRYIISTIFFCKKKKKNDNKKIKNNSNSNNKRIYIDIYQFPFNSPQFDRLLSLVSEIVFCRESLNFIKFYQPFRRYKNFLLQFKLFLSIFWIF